jgi:hypothetical protein
MIVLCPAPSQGYARSQTSRPATEKLSALGLSLESVVPLLERRVNNSPTRPTARALVASGRQTAVAMGRVVLLRTPAVSTFSRAPVNWMQTAPFLESEHRVILNHLLHQDAEVALMRQLALEIRRAIGLRHLQARGNPMSSGVRRATLTLLSCHPNSPPLAPWVICRS